MTDKKKNKLIWGFVYLSIATISSFFITYAFIGNDILELSKENIQIKERLAQIEGSAKKWRKS